MSEISTSVLAEAAACFKDARKSVYEGAALLYQIHENNVWEGRYSSFSEYVEQECQISKSYASKLLQAWRFYVIEGGVSKSSLVGIDADKLYLATKLPSGTVEQRMVKAREWNRDDLRAELSTVDGVECVHPDDKRVIICGICGKRVA